MPFLRRFLIPLLLFVFSFGLYLSTLAPGMLRGDSGEFQWAMVSLNVAHATGYPLFTLVGNLWQYVLPLGTVAYRLNLLAAIFGALTIAFVYQFACELVQSRLAALAAACFLAVAPVFWFNASILEVYTLNALFLVVILRLLWRWTRSYNYRLLFGAVFLLGLALAHHRMMLLAVPGIALYILWNNRELLKEPRDLAQLALTLVPGLALYPYVIIRLINAGETWQYAFNDIILGREFQGSFFREFHLLEIFKIPFDNFGLGLVLALFGAVLLFRRDVKLGTLFALMYLTDALFALAYTVPDLEVFLTPSFVIIALWIAFGVQGLSDAARKRFTLAPQLIGGTALVLALVPILKWGDIQTQVVAEMGPEKDARAILSANLPQNALLELDWETATAIRYLQTTEKLRPDLEARLIHLDRRAEYFAVLKEVSRGRPVFLDPSVQIDRFVAGYVWRHELGNLIRLSEAQDLATFIGLSVNENLQLTAFQSDADKTVLLWKVLHPLGDDYATYIHYFDTRGHALGQQDKASCCESIYAYKTSQWEANALIADYYRPLPPGTAYLRLGLYKKDQNDDVVQYGDTIYVQVQDQTLDGLQVRVDANFDDKAILRGYALTRVGDKINLELFWEATGLMQADYTVFVHELDAQNQIVVQADHQPLGGLYPTRSWRVGQTIRELVPLDVQPNVTKLRVGLYDAKSGARLRLSGGQEDSVEIIAKY